MRFSEIAAEANAPLQRMEAYYEKVLNAIKGEELVGVTVMEALRR